MAADGHGIAVKHIESRILVVRGHKVMLDADLATLYQVPAKVLNQAVKRNIERFPEDFMFQLTAEEAARLRSQTVTLKPGRGRHRKYLPYVFTEQGVAMRAFVRLRHMLASHADLARKLDALERKYDAQFKIVFDAIRRLMTPSAPTPRRIGFRGDS